MKYLLLLTLITAPAGAISLTFDDLAEGPVYYYEGLEFLDGGIIDGLNLPGSGYEAGIVSPRNGLIPRTTRYPMAIRKDTPFLLEEAYFTAAFRDNLDLRIRAYGVRGIVLHDQTFTLSAYRPTLLSLNWKAYHVTLQGSGGTPIPNPYGGASTHFLIDNLSYSDTDPSGIPEPPRPPPHIPEAPAALLALMGLACFVGVRRAQR